MKYSLCIEALFEKVDFYDRIKLAADAGLDAIEFWDPADKDVDKIASLTQNYGLEVAICTTMTPWDLRMNEDYKTVEKAVAESIKRAKAMNCPSLIGLSGDIDSVKNTQKGILINNLNIVKGMCEAEGVTINMEILNSYIDHKGYYLDCSHEGFEIVRSVHSDNVKVLFDIYHMQIMEGNIINTIKANIDKIGHFHSAGNPGRNEHYIGEINYPGIIAEIKKLDYDGYFGLEYWPTFDDVKSLEKVLAYLKS
ncbi:MAG: TIM barrel protein [Clostridia bacterium]|jgi:hydroxypyruvate isomerase|nr:TIM barrel protein [Clostridia bacterium]